MFGMLNGRPAQFLSGLASATSVKVKASSAYEKEDLNTQTVVVVAKWPLGATTISYSRWMPFDEKPFLHPTPAAYADSEWTDAC